MADDYANFAVGQLVRFRAEDTVRRSRLLVSASRELIQRATRGRRQAVRLLNAIDEVHGFIQENRRDLERNRRRERTANYPGEGETS